MMYDFPRSKIQVDLLHKNLYRKDHGEVTFLSSLISSKFILVY